MNRYNNKYGFHSPKMTGQILEYMNRMTPMTWEDSSWHNDLIDSISYEKNGEVIIQIMLPNSFIDDAGEELINYFTIINEDMDTLIETTNIHEIIKFVNNFDKINGLEDNFNYNKIENKYMQSFLKVPKKNNYV